MTQQVSGYYLPAVLGEGPPWLYLPTNRLTNVNGILYRKWLDTTTDEVTLQYVLPDKYKTSVLQLLHDDKLAGHLGIKRTIARVRHRFYWVGYTKYID
jgi:hypothetical protein